MLLQNTVAVSFQSPSGCEGRDESAAAVFPTYEKPQLHRMKRCNTMPVQQAEAMQQLLRQVRGDCSAAGMCLLVVLIHITCCKRPTLQYV